MIGGVTTTSKMHTVVKISPNSFSLDYPVIHILDASCSITIVSSLLSSNKEDFVNDFMEEYNEMRED